MNDLERKQPSDQPRLIDRATAEAMGYRTVSAAEYAAQRDAELLAQLQREGMV